MVMKKIFEGISDEEIHNDFMKFSRGEFKNKYLVEAKKQASKTAIKTSAEFTNSIEKVCLKNLKGPTQLRGVIVSTMDLSEELGLPIIKKSNFQGVRKLQIDTEVEPQKILDLMEKYPKVFFALSFKTDEIELKVKPKAPKSGKPGKNNEEGPKVDFCTLKTNNSEIINEILFDVSDFKELKINHTINITDIVYPDNMEELSPKEVRKQAKRKGVVVRNAVVDGANKVSEKEFVA
ncbi:hypothetical protein CMI41_03040 [Candidatus Pacearchaeota archaeon]|nr:hypothetical protein [Candidatus Pacearchaeota archaeon]|tara:strand:+ start:20326 stop:21030 length:705 start_codon:yes stop_codon:yes gene_type:complete